MPNDTVNIPTELETVAGTLRDGHVPVPVTVRELLGYFGAKRRGIYIVDKILEALNSLNLKTEPDFQDAWIDAEVSFILSEDQPQASSTHNLGDEASLGDDASEARVSEPPGLQLRDPTFRIGALEAANSGVVSVKPDEPLSLAITRMLAQDYS